MQQLYSFLILCYGFSIRIASVFSTKAALWTRGRKNYWVNLEKTLASYSAEEQMLAWFHCASLGEFEQGRPIIEAFKQKYPEYKIMLTFFSPSGFEVRKTYSGADFILYLPLDTKANAKRFVNKVKPNIVFYVKYEFWFNFLSCLQSSNIPTVLFSALFRPDQHFFKSYGFWTRKILKGFTRLFVQNENSKGLLNAIGIYNVEVCGDTRFDRVATIAENPMEIEIARAFSKNHTVVIAGSTWPDDETLILKLVSQSTYNIRLIIAPHEIHREQIDFLIQNSKKRAVTFSATDVESVKDAEILIIDSIGMLSNLYQYGTLAYIGGGFGVGIHNILEAAAFGLPVYFGPNYKKFNEAKELIKLKGAYEIRDPEDLITKVDALLSDKELYTKASVTSKNYVLSGRGATDMILKSCEKFI